MPLPRVYADFNAIECPLGESLAEMPITGFGTLMSLAEQGLRLTEGMSLILYEPDDIECEAQVHFDWSRTDPAGRQGEWVARFDLRLNRESKGEVGLPLQVHPCIVCGNPFFGSEIGRDYTAKCMSCGASVMEPMLPPNKTA